ncbi:MAG TPA: M28 family metallopeptidase [Allosphingosinicella sp.]|nr:M28 family metallopeptidase [Allosphingosinicella sp.]
MRFLILILLALAGCATAGPPAREQRAAAWWTDVVTLSSDAMEGRLTGTPGYDRAAAFVVQRLRALGLEPAGSEGYHQRVEFEEQFLDPGAARVRLVARGGGGTMLRVPEEMVVSRRAPLPTRLDAPLVFVGYGLHMPEAGHDDFAGMDLRGKIAVYVAGGPASVSGALKSHARAERARLLAERGAVGAIGITPAAQLEAPWARTAAGATQSGMYFADPAIRSVPGTFFEASVDPAQAERLFARSGRRFAEIAALSDAGGAVPRFELNQWLRGTLAPRTRRLASPNIVARLPGSDPRLAAEHVVLSAHLDGLGTDNGNGDRIYNGALDNAAGVAALLDIAAELERTGARPRRSILFVFVTAEEKGLLGARYFARRPTVPRESIVADLNYDMALPLYPLTGIIVVGAEESGIGAEAAAVARAIGLPLVPDPFPNRNAFTRSDQYAFIEQGIPAAAFKFGFAAGTAEAETERAWRATHYHSTSDDGSQPVFREDEIRLHDFIAALTLRIANAETRPRWHDTSFFRRFAR